LQEGDAEYDLPFTMDYVIDLAVRASETEEFTFHPCIIDTGSANLGASEVAHALLCSSYLEALGKRLGLSPTLAPGGLLLRCRSSWSIFPNKDPPDHAVVDDVGGVVCLLILRMRRAGIAEASCRRCGGVHTSQLSVEYTSQQCIEVGRSVGQLAGRLVGRQ
jgi:hypothetical protein